MVIYISSGETGLYYCQSRYYNPRTARWLNADASEVLGMSDHVLNNNLYAYTGNNPVNMADRSGYAPQWTDKLKRVIKTASNKIRKTKSYKALVKATQKGMFPTAFNIGGFVRDSKTGTYHARQNCLQRFGGFNDFYDWVFDAVTYMKNAKFPFTYNNKGYVFWAWKGDYLNLGAGAEMGFYYGNNGYHYFVDTKLTLPMHMALRYKNKLIIQYGIRQLFEYNRFWWITGFNPAYQNVNPSNLKATFSIDFSKTAFDRGLFGAFYKKYKSTKGWTFVPESYRAKFVF